MTDSAWVTPEDRERDTMRMAPPEGCDDFPVWKVERGYRYMRCACGATAAAKNIATERGNRQQHYKGVRQVQEARAEVIGGDRDG